MILQEIFFYFVPDSDTKMCFDQKEFLGNENTKTKHIKGIVWVQNFCLIVEL